jgi:hypothetical protein
VVALDSQEAIWPSGKLQHNLTSGTSHWNNGQGVRDGHISRLPTLTKPLPVSFCDAFYN